MTDLRLIIELMRQNTDALGFIPHPDLKTRWIHQGRYLMQRDARNRRIGYLLHGPIHPNGDLFLNQICLELDKRRRAHATRLLSELIALAAFRGARQIRLRCAQDLEAIEFWRSVGAIPSPPVPGGKRRNRVIQPFTIPILGERDRQNRF
jgi:GNAT superfamily N-acetyltransferase